MQQRLAFPTIKIHRHKKRMANGMSLIILYMAKLCRDGQWYVIKFYMAKTIPL
jgi:hypothetical protein